MAENALAVPLEVSEIIEIACQELRKRLQTLSPLQGVKEYAGFEIAYNHTIKLYRIGESGGGLKETLAWGTVKGGEKKGEPEVVSDKSTFKTGTDVNQVRLDHDLPLTIESGDGKGGKIRRKQKMNDDR